MLRTTAQPTADINCLSLVQSDMRTDDAVRKDLCGPDVGDQFSRWKLASSSDWPTCTLVHLNQAQKRSSSDGPWLRACPDWIGSCFLCLFRRRRSWLPDSEFHPTSPMTPTSLVLLILAAVLRPEMQYELQESFPALEVARVSLLANRRCISGAL